MDYRKVQNYWKVKEESSIKMDPPMNLIKLVPVEADFLNSDFKNEGFDSRQHFLFKISR